MPAVGLALDLEAAHRVRDGDLFPHGRSAVVFVVVNVGVEEEKAALDDPVVRLPLLGEERVQVGASEHVSFHFKLSLSPSPGPGFVLVVANVVARGPARPRPNGARARAWARPAPSSFHSAACDASATSADVPWPVRV